MPLSASSHHRRRASLLALTLGLSLSACYSYRTAAPAALAPGTQVRLQLTANGAVALTEAAGYRLREVGGTVQGVVGDTALVMLPVDITTVDGDVLSWRRGALTIPLSALSSTEQRTINRRRTAGAVGAVVAAFTGVVYYALKSISGGSGTTLAPGPGTPE